MQTDYAGHTIEVVDPGDSRNPSGPDFCRGAWGVVADFCHGQLGASGCPIGSKARPEPYRTSAGFPKAIVCDNLKAGVAKALWFEPTLNQTFAAMAEHYDTTILPTRSRKPRDKGKVEGAVLIVERWILARLRHRRFFSVADLNTAIGVLLEDLNNRPMRQFGKSRRQLFEEIERAALGAAAGRAVRIRRMEVRQGASRLSCRSR